MLFDTTKLPALLICCCDSWRERHFIDTDNGTKGLFVIFSFKYDVTTEAIQQTILFVFKNTIIWKDIICVRIIEKSNENEVTIALYNQGGKCVLDMGTNMENA